MRNYDMKNLIMICLFAVGVTGCSTGTLITKEGTTQNPKWHQANDVVLNKDLGTFPNLQSLSQVRQGMTKDQLYELIGRPHYDDGWRPREWNYLFHFTTPGQGENGITTCQYKILFDYKMLASSFYWNPVNPKDAVCPPSVKPVKEAEEKISIKRYTLESDALFGFDERNLESLNPKGRENLDRLSLDLNAFKNLNLIKISGYTDRLGTANYNVKLSQDRADAIKQYLISKGVSAEIISAIGYGSENPVKECENNISRTELISCLAPNRRVVIEVDGYIEKKVR